MEGSDTLGLSPQVQRSEIAEPDNPRGISPKSFCIEKRKKPRAAITPAKRPNRTDIPSAETAVEDFGAVGVGAPELAISCLQTLRNHCLKSRRFNRNDSRLNHLI